MCNRWSTHADSQGNVACLRLRYPWALEPLLKAYAITSSPELQQQYECQAQPLLEELLDCNGLEWALESDISLGALVCYHGHGGYLVTPAELYSYAPDDVERLSVPLAAVPV